MQTEILQLGAVGVVFFFAIKEFFSYLKVKKMNGGGNTETSAAILEQLQLMNNNHLHSLQNAIKSGNDRLIKTIHDDNMKMIELLGEIKGKLK